MPSPFIQDFTEWLDATGSYTRKPKAPEAPTEAARILERQTLHRAVRRRNSRIEMLEEQVLALENTVRDQEDYIEVLQTLVSKMVQQDQVG